MNEGIKPKLVDVEAARARATLEAEWDKKFLHMLPNIPRETLAQLAMCIPDLIENIYNDLKAKKDAGVDDVELLRRLADLVANTITMLDLSKPVDAAASTEKVSSTETSTSFEAHIKAMETLTRKDKKGPDSIH